MPNILKRSQRQVLRRCIGTKHNVPATRARHALHTKRFRLQIHNRYIQSKFDIDLPRFKTCIFVHGCFRGMKIVRNREPDRERGEALKRNALKVGVFRECWTKTDSRDRPAIEEIASIRHLHLQGANSG